jgi:steroid 5-alpha reductase family enzyme
MKKSKVLGILVIIASYIIAFGIGAVLHYRINFSNELFLLKLLIIDVAMTIVIFIFSTIFKNSSIYDPYWSLIPIVLSIYASYVLCGFHGMSYIMIGLLCIWGLRLTINFFNTFKGLDKQDWRYDHYKNKFPRIWPLVNFFGIHLFPTLIVYMVMLPVFKYLETCETAELNLSTIIVIIIALVAIVIESIADRQMHKFLKTRKNNSYTLHIRSGCIEIRVLCNCILRSKEIKNEKSIFFVSSLALSLCFSILRIRKPLRRLLAF